MLADAYPTEFHAMPSALLALLLVLPLVACGGQSNASPPGTAPDAHTAQATDAEPDWRAPNGPAPWDDGWKREWFYAYPRPADDWRWARMAQHVGHPAPALESLSQWLHGEATSLDDLRGRVVLLKFWATWCGDCLSSVAATEAIAERLADDVTVLEVCATKGGDAYAATVERWGIEQLTALDATGASEAAYDVPRWPFYVLIDREGIVRATGLKSAHVDAALDHLLALEDG